MDNFSSAHASGRILLHNINHFKEIVPLLALSIDTQRLCINFYVSRANFLITLRSHLDIFCYFWSKIFDVYIIYSYIYLVKL